MAIDTLEQQWNKYLAAYGPVAADEREFLLKQSVADDVVFTNPEKSASAWRAPVRVARRLCANSVEPGSQVLMMREHFGRGSSREQCRSGDTPSPTLSLP